MEDLLKALQQPEYVHVILNHLPITGLLAGLLVLVIAIFQKSRATAIAAYSVIFLMSLSVIPVTEYGEKAEDNVESLLDGPAHKWLHEHEERAEKTSWIFYATAAAAAGGLFLPRYVPKSGLFFLWVTLFLGAAAVAGGMWAASAGGKIMHREFRYSLPPGEASAEN
ncbi:MAG: hypothetical protein ABIT76_14020 [Chthoniobacterales bacterium]